MRYKNKDVWIIEYYDWVSECSCGCTGHEKNRFVETFFCEQEFLERYNNLILNVDGRVSYWHGTVQKGE